MKKKILIFCLLLIFPLLFCSCSDSLSLTDSVCELRSDVFYGECETVSLRAGYGFKETPSSFDKTVGQRKYLLTFKIVNAPKESAEYTLSFDFSGHTYSTDFALNPITHSLTATIEVDNFTLKEFDVSVLYSGTTKSIKMHSVLPNDTMSYEQALKHLQKNQSSLISSHLDSDGRFNAEIIMRVIVKEQKSYWYVGIACGSDNLKALLLNGTSGEVLAIREVL